MPQKKSKSTEKNHKTLQGIHDITSPPARAAKALPIEKLRWRVDPKKLGFKTTKDVKPLRSIVGQPRALEALRLGTELHARGYNIFVSGISATGRSTAVKSILESLKLHCEPAPDRCYVYNFKYTDQPRLISLPRGRGIELKKDMAALVQQLRDTVPHALDDESVLTMKRELAEEFARKEADIFRELEQKVASGGFALVQVQMGPYTRPDVFPIIDGKPVAPNQVGQLVEEGKFPKENLEDLYKQYQGYKAELRAVLKQVRKINRELQDKTREIEREVMTELLRDYFQEIHDKYPVDSVRIFLDEVSNFIIDNPDIFGDDQGDQPPGMGQPMVMQPMPGDDPKMLDPFRLFEVNVVRDGTIDDPCPVVIEHHPNYLNLFGTVEREWRMGGYYTSDFTMIKCGSLLKADGGFLVLNVMDVLEDGIAWRTLMRTLKTRKLQIQAMDSLLSIAPMSIKPEPIEIDVTVILIGESWIYHLLSTYVEDFSRVFKVRADFDTVMPRGIKQVGHYASLARKLVELEGLLHFNADAIAAIAEEGAKRASRAGKMSARFGDIADLMREASHYAKLADKKVIGRDDVEKAIELAEYRQDLIREKMDEYISDKIIMIDTSGKKRGQINALAVYDLGTFAFGRPTRITCEFSIGERGVVNIEREAKLSGSIHDKGMLILEGYLRHVYGEDGPLSLSASIAFEQSYSMIDGDSASLAEALVLTSELSGLPLRQDLAVTGSINQKGEVQAIGGVNEKIEGFFRTCEHNGLTGTQGVVIPSSNVSELMLSNEILKAVTAKKFHIYEVSTVDEAIEIFTGIKAGNRNSKGKWTSGSVHDHVIRTIEFVRRKENGTADSEDSKRSNSNNKKGEKSDKDDVPKKRVNKDKKKR